MRRIYLLIIALVLFSGANAQPGKKDSLLRMLATAKEDTAKVNYYNSIGDMYEYSVTDSAKFYYRKAWDLAASVNFRQGILKSTRNFTGACLVANQFDSALFYSKINLEDAQKFKDSLAIGIAFFNLGISYRFLSQMEMAVKYSLDGARILEASGQKSIAAQVNDGLQVLYMTMGQYDKAIYYGEKAVQQAKELKNNQFLSVALNNLALSYMEIDSLTENAKQVLEESIQASAAIENFSAMAAAYNNLSGIAINQEKYELAASYARKSLVSNEQLNSDENKAISLRALSIYYLHTKDFPKAKYYADSSLRLTERTNSLSEKGQNYRVQTIIAYASGDLIGGGRYFRLSDKIFAQIFNESLLEKEASMRIRFETEKKELHIAQLEAEKKVQQLTISKKNILNYILIGGAVALATIFFLSYRSYRQKQRLQQQRIGELETEKKLAATEAVLKGEEQERTRLAKDLHDGLGGMLSGIKYSLNTMKGNLIMTPDNAQAFERSMDMLESSIKEMRRVAHNMMPEALVKFGLDTALKDFCNDINQSGAIKINYQSFGLGGVELDQTVSITIYRIIQELINNTIKHAAATSAIVQLTKNDDQLSVTVEDNGKGFDTVILNAAKGIGWSNVQNRVEFLKGKLDVNSSPGNGTSIHIEFGI